MSELVLLIGWIIAASLTLFAGVVLLLVVAVVYTIEDDRRLMEKSAAGFRPEAGGQGCNQGSGPEGSGSLHIFNGRKS
jgi:hypothetical protein